MIISPKHFLYCFFSKTFSLPSSGELRKIHSIQRHSFYKLRNSYASASKSKRSTYSFYDSFFFIFSLCYLTLSITAPCITLCVYVCLKKICKYIFSITYVLYSYFVRTLLHKKFR